MARPRHDRAASASPATGLYRRHQIQRQVVAGILSEDAPHQSLSFGVLLVVERRRGGSDSLFQRAGIGRLTIQFALGEVEIHARPVEQRPLGRKLLEQISKPFGRDVVPLSLKGLHRLLKQRHALGVRRLGRGHAAWARPARPRVRRPAATRADDLTCPAFDLPGRAVGRTRFAISLDFSLPSAGVTRQHSKRLRRPVKPSVRILSFNQYFVFLDRLRCRAFWDTLNRRRPDLTISSAVN